MQKYIINENKNEKSIIIYIPNILKKKTYDEIKNELDNINDWKIGKTYDGKKIKRKQKWYQINNYPFCKSWNKQYDRWKSNPYTENLLQFQKHIQITINKILFNFNKNYIQLPKYDSLLINYYENGLEHITPHQDSKESFGIYPTISIISIGEKRKFILADTPGHEQYTRNMVTAASNAYLAIILIDARKGVLEQTKRHSFIANMVGIKNIIVAVNKMDLVDFSEDIFKAIKKDYQINIAAKLNFDSILFIPISALKGDNIMEPSSNISWYDGDAIMSLLETEKIEVSETDEFAMPVQNVIRPDLDFRGFSGRVASGKITIDESVVVGSSNQSARVKQIYIGDERQKECTKGDSVTITLDKEIDISRGDILSTPNNNIEDSNLVNSNLIWFDQYEGYLNRFYYLKIGTRIINAKIIKLKHKIDINSYANASTNKLSMNNIVECEISIDEKIEITPYSINRTMGSFILIDKQTNLTVGAGVINHTLRRSKNVVWESTDITLRERRNITGHTSKVIWFTGLSG